MKRFARIFAVCLCVALLLSGIGLLLPGRALADNNARDYIPAPAGILAVLIYYENVTAQNLYVRGSTGPHFGGTTNLGLSENLGILRVIYFCDIPTPFGPMRASPQFLVPFGSVSLNTEAEEVITDPICRYRRAAVTQEFAVGSNTASTGFGAPFILSQFWLLRCDRTKSYVAVTPFVFFPTGQYNDYKAVNIGVANWQFREELNGTQGFEVIPGHFGYFEVTLGSSQFTNNNDYGPYRQTAVYAPTFTVESHLSYDLTKTVFASADFYGHYAGTYRVDPLYGIPTEKVGAIGESSVGGSLAYSFAPGFQIMAQYRADVSVANGPAANIFLLRFLWATDLNSLMGNPQAKQ